MQNRIKVLLSAYNGEKYIAQQLDSIISQSLPPVEILVRDDGSSDGTVTILEKYASQGLITLVKGENAGFAKSFLSLVKLAGDADYYAFSDQDDIWLPDKLARAADALSKVNNDVPVLYFANYDQYDELMNFMSKGKPVPPKMTFTNSLLDCVPLGFNTVFNSTARKLTIEKMPEKTTGHDWWMYMLCTGLGKVIYDEKPTVKYRRHGTTVSNAGDTFFKQQVWRFKRFFLNGYFDKIHDQIVEFRDLYGDRLNKDDRKLIDLFSKSRLNPLTTARKIFSPVRYRQALADEVLIRIIILLGRI